MISEIKAPLLVVLVAGIGPLCFFFVKKIYPLVIKIFLFLGIKSFLFYYLDYVKKFLSKQQQKSQIFQGKKLERCLLHATVQGASGVNWSKLPEYKYFSKLLISLLELQRKFGRSIEDSLLILKKNLSLDLLYEHRIREKITQVVGQCLLMAFGQWGMLLFMASQMQLSLPAPLLIFIAFWQVLGLTILFWHVRVVQKKVFYHFAVVAQKVFTWMVLCQTDMDFSKMANLAVLNFGKLKSKSFDPTGYLAVMEQNMTEVIEIWRKTGRTPAKDFNRLGSLLTEVFNSLQDTFIKKVDLSVLFIMLFFFFASYLLSLMWLMSSLLKVLDG